MQLNPQIRRRFKRYWKQRSHWIICNFIAFAIAMIHIAVFSSSVGEQIEASLVDLWFTVRGPIIPPQDIVIVGVNDTSYGELGISTLAPFPRMKFAILLEKLSKAKARLAILDFIFKDAGPDQEEDRRLASALKTLPTFIGSYTVLKDNLPKDNIEQKVENILPFHAFSENAKRVVLMNLPNFGMIREFSIYYPKLDLIPPLPAALIMEDKGELSSPKKGDYINYYGPPKTMPTIPIYQALKASDETMSSLFAGKTVIIGTISNAGPTMALKDSFETPTSDSAMPGVEIHANVTANILHQRWIQRFSKTMESLFLNLLALSLSIFILHSKPLRGILIFLLALVSWSGASFLLFRSGYFLPGKILFFYLLPLAYSIAVLYYYLVLQRSHHSIEEALGIRDSLH